jgi:hypothetical protein
MIPSTPSTSRRSASRRASSGRRRRSSRLRRRRVEGNEHGLGAAALGQERQEVAASVLAQHDRLAVGERAVAGEAANRLSEPCETIGEVGAAAAPDLDALALFAGEEREGPGWIESNTARNLSIFPATANQPCNNVGPGLDLLVGPQDAIRVCVNEDALTIDEGSARSGI